MNIKPIKTIYKEIQFRSTLEARWAREFDLLEIKWEYEPKKFLNLDGSSYLPDFLLFDKIFVELKSDWKSWLKAKDQKASIWKAIKENKIIWVALVGYPESLGEIIHCHLNKQDEELVDKLLISKFDSSESLERHYGSPYDLAMKMLSESKNKYDLRSNQ